MAVDISDLLAERKKVDVEFGPHVIQVWYNPASLTEEVEEVVAEALRSEKGSESVRTYLVAVLKDWDLTKDGEKVPITNDAIRKNVPSLVSTHILRAVSQDMFGNLGEGSSSSGGR